MDSDKDASYDYVLTEEDSNVHVLTEEDNNSNWSLLLPAAFLDFLKENGLDPSAYLATIALGNIPRYIRLKPGCESQLPEIEAELKCQLEKVNWLPGFFAIPPHIQIASTNAYRSGKIYGMDAASGAAVMALNISPGDHILDLCAAPGAKLCMLSDLLGSSGSLTGVDIAKHRLAACRTMLQKYALGNRCRLFIADGTSFSLLPLSSHTNMKSNATYSEDKENIFAEWSSKRLRRDRKNASKGKNASELQAVLETTEPELIFYGRDSGVVGLHRIELFRAVDEMEYLVSGYDKIFLPGLRRTWRMSSDPEDYDKHSVLHLLDERVLVDAECTHDGSFKHIQKFEYWGWKTLQRRVLDANRTDNLMHLQLKLLSNGFRLLKVGGSLVYSTCSLTFSQNEDVVEQFLSKNSSAVLQEIKAADNWQCRSGRIPKTLRFDPRTSQTGGLFIAKLKKVAV